MTSNPRSSQIACLVCIPIYLVQPILGTFILYSLAPRKAQAFQGREGAERKQRKRTHQMKFTRTSLLLEIIANCIKLFHIIISNDNVILRAILKVIVFSEAIHFSNFQGEQMFGFFCAMVCFLLGNILKVMCLHILFKIIINLCSS